MPLVQLRLEMEAAALAFMASQSEPVGSRRLMQALGDAGIRVAEATAGRLLHSLDEQGFTVSVKTTRGRTITPAGEAHLAILLRNQRRVELTAGLVEAISAADVQSLLDLLSVRRAIEPEGAHQAALRASDAEIEAIVRDVEAVPSADENDANVGPAMDFHRALLDASQNPVLIAVASLLLDPHNDYLAQLQRRISAATGNANEYIGDHQRIARFLQARDAAGAERAMRDHINRMIADVTRYRESTDRVEDRSDAVALRNGDAPRPTSS